MDWTKRKLRERFASCDIFYRLISFFEAQWDPRFSCAVSCLLWCVRYFRHLNHIINKFDCFREFSFLFIVPWPFFFIFFVLNISANANHVIPRRSNCAVEFRDKIISVLYLFLPTFVCQSTTPISLERET